VVRDALALTALASEAGRVHEDERSVAALHDGVDRVARCPWPLGDDHPVLAYQRVDEARLAHVRPSEDRDADRVLGDLRTRCPAGEALQDRVQEVAGAVTMHGGDRNRLAQPESVKLVDLVSAR